MGVNVGNVLTDSPQNWGQMCSLSPAPVLPMYPYLVLGFKRGNANERREGRFIGLRCRLFLLLAPSSQMSCNGHRVRTISPLVHPRVSQCARSMQALKIKFNVAYSKSEM